MNDVFEIPAGSRVFLGAPTNSISQDAVNLLRNLVSNEPEVIEAHIPQCYIPSMMTEPHQVLFVICSSRGSVERSVTSLTKHLAKAILLDGIIDIFPLTVTHELVSAVRGAGCQIYQQKGSPDEVSVNQIV